MERNRLSYPHPDWMSSSALVLRSSGHLSSPVGPSGYLSSACSFCFGRYQQSTGNSFALIRAIRVQARSGERSKTIPRFEFRAPGFFRPIRGHPVPSAVKTLSGNHQRLAKACADGDTHERSRRQAILIQAAAGFIACQTFRFFSFEACVFIILKRQAVFSKPP